MRGRKSQLMQQWHRGNNNNENCEVYFFSALKTARSVQMRQYIKPSSFTLCSEEWREFERFELALHTRCPRALGWVCPSSHWEVCRQPHQSVASGALWAAVHPKSQPGKRTRTGTGDWGDLLTLIKTNIAKPSTWRGKDRAVCFQFRFSLWLIYSEFFNYSF